MNAHQVYIKLFVNTAVQAFIIRIDFMTVFGKITAALRRQEPTALWMHNPSTATDVNVTLLTHSAITCRCGGMAIPTQVKGNHYRCIHCEKTMTNISYNLGQRDRSEDGWTILPKDDRHVIDMSHYNDAVIKIQQMYGNKARTI